jgi:autotransporter-associated beta strand protein
LGAPANRITFLGSGTLQAQGSILMSASRGISINSGATASFDPHGNTLTVLGAISGQGALSLTGSGTLVLSNTNTYLGGTFIESGALEATSTGSLPGAFTPGNVHVADGATLILAVGGSQQWTAANISLLLAESGLFSPGASFSLDNSGGSIDYSSINTHGVGLEVGGNDSSTTLTGVSGSGSLTKIGSGTIVLTGSNTYTGGTDVISGTLVVATASGLADGTGLIIGSSPLFAPIVPTEDESGKSLFSAANPAAVPEPGTVALVVLALVAICARRCIIGVRRLTARPTVDQLPHV